MTDTMQKDNETDWDFLAGIRFLLASCVVITHSGIVAPGYFLFRWLGHTGYAAVFGFLMISGYSIASSLARESKGYVLRRLKRIYPSYLVAIALTFAVTLLGPLHLPEGQLITHPSVWEAFGNLLMLQGIFVPVLAANGALWSLSIEWWCYMIGGILSKVGNWLSLLLTAASFISMITYCRLKGVALATELPWGWNVALMVWSWLAGFVYFRQQSKVNFLIMMFLPMIMVDMLVPLEFSSVVLSVSALSILFSGTITIKSGQVRAFLNFLGNASYPLYLLHTPLLFFIVGRTSIRNGNILIAIVIPLVVAGYFASTRAWNMSARKVIGGPVH